MRLLIIRHGESEMNVQGVLAGHSPTPLTALGRAQARLLGARLAAESIDVVYSSDLLRAAQTTQEIAEFVTAPVHFDSRLRERTWGEFDAQPLARYQASIPAAAEPFYRIRPVGGESLEDMQVRVGPFIEELRQKHPGQTVLLSAHHTTNKSILKYLLSFDWEQWVHVHQENTCLNLLECTSDGVDAVRINCSEHLSATNGVRLEL